MTLESANNKIKAKYWAVVMYPENMRSDWQDCIDEVLQQPFAYCIHDKDFDEKLEDRKTHVHIMVAFPNTTTYKHAMQVFSGLNDFGKSAFNTCEVVNNVRFYYDYLIHDTDNSRKKGKYQYSKEERITGNNFDIGSFEQISLAEKKRMRMELAQVIIKQNFTNYMDFYAYVLSELDDEYEDICVGYSGHFARLTKGNYQKRYSGSRSGDIG